MKKLVLALTVMFVVVTGMADQAAAIKTDPVLKPVDLASVKTDPVLRGSNFASVLEMVELLKARGAKVEIRIESIDGMEWAQITVNGKPLSPYLLGCKNCAKIEFEY